MLYLSVAFRRPYVWSKVVVIALVLLAGLGPNVAGAGCAQAKEQCGLFKSCCGSLRCNLFAAPAECRHAPPIEGETCSIFSPCAGDLYCKGFQDGLAGRCAKPSLLGESCDGVIRLCAEGLKCRQDPRDVNPNSIDIGNGRCFPEVLGDSEEVGLDWQNDDACLSIYSASVHRNLPVSSGDLWGGTHAMSFGSGWAGQAGVAGSAERGGVYGDNGSFGCYRQLCAGGGMFGLAHFVALSEFESFESATSTDDSFQLSAGVAGMYGWSTSVFWNIDPQNPQARPIGFGSALSMGAQLGGDAQLLVCRSDQNTVVENFRPITGPHARCRDVSACADADSCVANVSVDAGSTAKNGAAPTLEQVPANPYSIGEHAVTLRVTDSTSAVDECAATIDVHDCTAPALTCRRTFAECQSNLSAYVEPLLPLVRDCSSHEIAGPPSGMYALGTTPIAYKVTDSYFNESSCATQIVVHDTVAPIIKALVVTPATLWPPNHALRPVHVTVDAMDRCDPEPSCRILSVKSNEPDRSARDRQDRPGDIVIAGPLSLQLRAERLGNGTGRIYAITVECADAPAGNVVRGEVNVTVPHDNSASGRVQR
jgi:hypothetical protein